MDIGVYRGHALVAAFGHGREPRYIGPAGREVQAVIAGLAGVDALWSEPPASDEARLLAANLFSTALAAQGFAVFCPDLPGWGVVPLFPIAELVGRCDGSGASAASREAGTG